MKVALCIHGQPRALNSTVLEYLRSVFSPDNTLDVFIHAWWDGNGRYENVGLRDEKYNIQLPPTFLNEVVRVLKPRKFLLEAPCDFALTSNFTAFQKAEPSHIMPMNYSIQKAFQLAAETDTYDWYVKARFDVIIQTQKPLDLTALDPAFVYVANIHPHGAPDGTLYVVPSRHVGAFTTIFDRIAEYGTQGIEETVLEAMMVTNNIPYRSLHLSYKLDRTQFRV